MNTSNTPAMLLWIVLPYMSITLFVAGHIWRYRRDQFGWTCRSSQLLESRLLAWGSNLFHYGALAAIAGHIVGILVPTDVTTTVGVTENGYHLLSAGAGTAAGLCCLVGLLILIYRRAAIPRVRRTTSYVDIAVYALLAAIIVLGILDTFVKGVLGGGYNYRATVGVWFRGIFLLHLHPELMASAPLLYQAHAATAWLLFALWPFSRLVHVWSVPVQYLGRPYILYRRRFAP